MAYDRMREIETSRIDDMIYTLDEYLHLLGRHTYDPYKEKQTKRAVRALLNIRGIKNLKVFNGRA